MLTTYHLLLSCFILFIFLVQLCSNVEIVSVATLSGSLAVSSSLCGISCQCYVQLLGIVVQDFSLSLPFCRTWWGSVYLFHISLWEQQVVDLMLCRMAFHVSQNVGCLTSGWQYCLNFLYNPDSIVSFSRLACHITIPEYIPIHLSVETYNLTGLIGSRIAYSSWHSLGSIWTLSFSRGGFVEIFMYKSILALPVGQLCICNQVVALSWLLSYIIIISVQWFWLHH